MPFQTAISRKPRAFALGAILTLTIGGCQTPANSARAEFNLTEGAYACLDPAASDYIRNIVLSPAVSREVSLAEMQRLIKEDRCRAFHPGTIVKNAYYSDMLKKPTSFQNPTDKKTYFSM